MELREDRPTDAARAETASQVFVERRQTSTLELAAVILSARIPMLMAIVAGALIGLAGAVGAFGGVGVNIAFRQSFLHTGSGDAAYLSFLFFYGVCFALTWAVYLRPRRAGRVCDAAPAT
jgi:nitrate/nitrite transporter NarK